VYWLGIRSGNLADDPAMLNYYKAESRQMGMLYGKEGLLFEELHNNLKQPKTQALLIGAGSVVVAAGCFIWARFPDNRDETVFETTPKS
jgi:hypothetical protein